MGKVSFTDSFIIREFNRNVFIKTDEYISVISRYRIRDRKENKVDFMVKNHVIFLNGNKPHDEKRFFDKKQDSIDFYNDVCNLASESVNK